MAGKRRFDVLKGIVCRVVATAESPPTATIKMTKDQAVDLRQKGVELKNGMPTEVVTVVGRDAGERVFVRKPVSPSLTFDNTDLKLGAGDFVRVAFDDVAGKPQGLRIGAAVNPGDVRHAPDVYLQMSTAQITQMASAALPDSRVANPVAAASVAGRKAFMESDTPAAGVVQRTIHLGGKNSGNPAL